MGSKITFGRVVGLTLVLAALVSGTASASVNSTPQGLKADGLRLQGIAQVYERMPTAQGLKADGLRLEAIAQVYQRMQDRPAASFYTPEALAADGQRLAGLADMYRRLENAPAASFYTPEALKAEGLRWQAMSQAYRGHRTASGSSSSSSTSGFDWGAAIIGAASMLGFATVGVALLVGARRVRRTKVAV
jgi:hypothetical protein